MIERNLTSTDIAQQEFKKGMRGYNAVEIDKYLDLIIADYDAYDNDIKYLKSENARLLAKIDELTKQVALTKTTTVATPATGVTNFDILKRISNLEKHVFGAKLDATLD